MTELWAHSTSSPAITLPPCCLTGTSSCYRPPRSTVKKSRSLVLRRGNLWTEEGYQEMMRIQGRRRWCALALQLLVLAVIAVWRITLPATRTGFPPMLTAVQNDGGMRLSISVPRWHFFLHELVPVTLILTNNSGLPVTYYGHASTSAPCGESALTVRMTNGGQDVLPVGAELGVSMSCPPPPSGSLPAGASLRLHVLVGLPAAGRLTLTSQAQFDQNARVVSAGLPPPDGPLGRLRDLIPSLFRSSHAPFASGWPSLTLWVLPQIPADRMLHLIRHGRTVQLRAPEAALSRAVVQQSSGYVLGRGACYAIDAGWQPLSMNALHDSQCGSIWLGEQWRVFVGAPGYAVASAVYCFDATPGMVGRCTERIDEHHT
jgi:hypothetical protein